MRLLALTAVFLMLGLHIAHATCEDDVAGLQKRASAITEPTRRAHVLDLVENARRELLEGEEYDCKSAAVIAEKALDTDK